LNHARAPRTMRLHSECFFVTQKLYRKKTFAKCQSDPILSLMTFVLENFLHSIGSHKHLNGGVVWS